MRTSIQTEVMLAIMAGSAFSTQVGACCKQPAQRHGVQLALALAGYDIEPAQQLVSATVLM